MTNIVLQPASGRESRRHFDTTLNPCVELVPSFTRHLTRTETSDLQRLYPGRTLCVPLWGVLPGVASRWNKLEVGDIVLFFRNMTYFAMGNVTYKFENAALATALWPSVPASGGRATSYQYMYAVDSLEDINIPAGTLNQAIGWEPSYPFRAFTVLTQHATTSALSKVATLYSHTEVPGTPGGSSFDPETPTERKAVVKIRLEQADIRKRLGLYPEAPPADCQLCGQVRPVDLLHAAHIKRRADCEDSEKADIEHIAMRACLFGCDALYEYGYIFVDDRGLIQRNPRIRPETILAAETDQYPGRPCTAFSGKTQRYFKDHRQRFGL